MPRFTGSTYLVSGKKETLQNIHKDLQESRKKLNIRLTSTYIKDIGRLKVRTDIQHADDTFWETVHLYRNKGYYVGVEIL